MVLDNELIEDSIFDSRYILNENIWNDGNRAYWRSHDKTLNREVVLFIVPIDSPDIDDSRENTKMTAGLQHPHIIPIYDLRETDNYLYAVHFYAQKQSILEYCEKPDSEPLSIEKILQLAQQLASAIDYIHDHNIIHGHIRPDVVLLDNNLNPYLTEFYVPRNREELLLKDGIVEYVAPEQFIDNNLSSSCDIYAFGLTLFELFVQRLPFEKNLNEPYLSSLGWKQSEDQDIEIPSVRQFRRDLPIGIDVVLQRLCPKKPEDRYQTATEAANDLNKYARQTDIEGKIFISYSSQDKEYVHKLTSELKKFDLEIWIDDNLSTGTKWAEDIQNALNECDIMLLIVTDASMKSDYVTHEWSYFMGRGKSVYPFVPGDLKKEEKHPRLKDFQSFPGTGDLRKDVARIVDVLAGGTPTKLGSSDT